MNTAVWAKLRYCPYWPARIVEPPQNLKKPPRKFCVYFFGSKNYGFVEIGSTLSYLEHRDKFIKKGRGKHFDLAVSECDELIKDPRSAEPDPQNQIMVARELDFLVKEEPNDDGEWYVNEAVNVCSSCGEKQDLIDQLKSDLKASTHKVLELEAASKRMESIHQIEVQELKFKLQHSGQCSEDGKYYVVERLLDHKKVNKKLQFLVKWAGYDDNHNTWVNREDLKCNQILKKYLKSKNLN